MRTISDPPKRIYADRGPRGGWMFREQRLHDTVAEYALVEPASTRAPPSGEAGEVRAFDRIDWRKRAEDNLTRAETAEVDLSDAVSALEQRDDLLIKAEKFRFGPYLTVESRGPSQWAVCDGGAVLNAFGEWEREPQPSNRTHEFTARTRFTFAQAVTKARALPTIKEPTDGK